MEGHPETTKPPRQAEGENSNAPLQEGGTEDRQNSKGQIYKALKNCWTVTRSLNFWLALGTWVLAIAAFYGIYDTGQRADNQLAEMRAEQRAWVRESVTIREPLAFDDEGNASIALQFFLLNKGHTPALEAWVLAELRPAYLSPSPKGEIIMTIDKNVPAGCLRPEHQQHIGHALIPGDNLPLMPQVYPVSKLAMAARRAPGGVILELIGCVDYVLVDGTHHQTGFVYILERLDGQRTTQPVPSTAMPMNILSLERADAGNYAN